MNRFAKIMQGVGWLGAALLAVVWAQGFVVRDDSPALARHSTIALAAACLCVLPQLWTIAFLLLAARGREKLHGKGKDSSGRPVAALAKRHRRQALFAALFALAGLGGSFALAGAIVVRRASPLAHAAAGFVAVALQIVALVIERRALVADQSAMAEITAADSNANKPVRGVS